MASEYGFITPTDKVVAMGEPIILGEFEVETATNMYPGRLVMKGSTAAEIVVNDTSSNATSLIGVLGYEQCDLNNRPDTVSTIYTVNKSAPVLRGHFIGLAWQGAAQTLTRGEPLQAGVDGCVSSATVGTNQVIAYSLQDQTTAGGATAALWVMWVL